LQRRYQTLVQQQFSAAQPVAAGLRPVPGATQTFAATQAAWRFYKNPTVALNQLAHPLLQRARTALAYHTRSYALVLHDWSLLHYNGHHARQDRIALSQKTDLGYTLQSALLISDRDGSPLAPVFQGLEAADGVHSSQSGCVEPPLSRLDALAPVMAFIGQLGWDKTPVHLIDAEADSVGHFRHWHRAGYRFLVRADGVNHVQHRGQDRSLEQVRQILRQQRRFRKARWVDFEGRRVRQWVAQATVTLVRPARLGRQGQRTKLRGEPLTLRLVVTELRDSKGNVPACWFLLTNVSAGVDAATIALWYYWRWEIESYYKLLKGAGLQLEHWQQETADAVARRLLVASMACVLVWQLACSRAPAAAALRTFLVRLSGRQMRRGCAFTLPALLAGLWVYLTMRAALEHYDLLAIERNLDEILTEPRDETPGEVFV